MIEESQQVQASPIPHTKKTVSSETHGPTNSHPSKYQSSNQNTSHSLLGRLRVIKVSPSKGKRPSNDESHAPLPNEIVLVDDVTSPVSCTEHEGIEASLESTKRILRKPCRFTFDIIPSFSESFGDKLSSPSSRMEEEDHNQEAISRNIISGLSIQYQLDSPLNAKHTVAGTISPTQLKHRSRTNSTCATSPFSAEDIFCRSSASIDVVKMTAARDVLRLNAQNTSTKIVSKGQNATESSWFNVFAILVGSY
jgi:hypothetical protein